MSETPVLDPNAPEGDAGQGGQYVTKRDVKVLILGSCLFLALLYPLYRMMKANAEKSTCGHNLGQVYEAINMYALDHDERFPPVFASNSDGTPYLDAKGHPYTWISDIEDHMSKRASFVCPSSTEAERATQQSKDSNRDIVSSYGMYAAIGGVARFNIENPDSAILVAETSNSGAKSTYDPLPLKGGNDGFHVGWSDSNDGFTPNSKSVTRLAFGDTQSGAFTEHGDSRHSAGIHMLTVSGQRVVKEPDSALLKIRDGWPTGLWNVPLSSRKR